MSGGVDSSVAAAILVRRGFDVTGVTLQIWQESQRDDGHSGCCSLGAVEDARRVARSLGIPHFVLNMRDEFKTAVIDRFVDSYFAGRTPNPCVDCNRFVKFEMLLDKLGDFGCDKLVSGHYARIRYDSKTGLYHLMQARGIEKDQSYVLYMLRQDQLAKLWFPLGGLPNKDETRRLARELGLIVADKPDSQEICFVSEAGGYREFLKRAKVSAGGKGEIIDSSGRQIGEHEGVEAFTVGQRRGLGVAAGKPLFVLRVDATENKVVVGSSEELLAKEVLLDKLHFPAETPEDGLKVMAKIRYNMAPKPARLYGGDEPKLVFREPVRAVTPGQIAVAYRGKSVVAGGEIRSQSRA